MAIASALPILAFAILVLALAALAALRSPGWRRPFWLLAAFLGALLPVSNLMPVPAFWGEVAMASRYLTFPLVFVCLASGVALCRLGQSVLARHAAVPWIGVIGWIVASAGVVHASIPVWKDDGALFRVAIERASPHTLPFLLLNVGAHHARLGEWESAREAFDIALQQRPPASVASVLWYSLGNVEQRSGRNTEAVAAFIRAMSIDPGNVLARVGLARTERARDNPAGAIAALEPAVRHADASGRRIQNEDAARLQLGLAYADAGRATEAIAQIERARALTQAGDLRVEADAALASLRQSGR